MHLSNFTIFIMVIFLAIMNFVSVATQPGQIIWTLAVFFPEVLLFLYCVKNRRHNIFNMALLLLTLGISILRLWIYVLGSR